MAEVGATQTFDASDIVVVQAVVDFMDDEADLQGDEHGEQHEPRKARAFHR